MDFREMPIDCPKEDVIMEKGQGMRTSGPKCQKLSGSS